MIYEANYPETEEAVRNIFNITGEVPLCYIPNVFTKEHFNKVAKIMFTEFNECKTIVAVLMSEKERCDIALYDLDEMKKSKSDDLGYKVKDVLYRHDLIDVKEGNEKK